MSDIQRGETMTLELIFGFYMFKLITVERINENANANANANAARLAESPQRGPVEAKIPAFLPTTDEAPDKRITF